MGKKPSHAAVPLGLEEKKFPLQTTADIRHFVFFTLAEGAPKNCLSMLSVR
jgi:hypothetical protein